MWMFLLVAEHSNSYSFWYWFFSFDVQACSNRMSYCALVITVDRAPNIVSSSFSRA